MKKLLISFCGFVIISCNSERQKEQADMDITVIRDITDRHELQPEANSILGLYNLVKNKSAGASFRYHEITDKVLVPIVSLHLPDVSDTKRINRKNEPFFRQRIILNFYDTIRKTLSLADTKSDSSTLAHSEIFKTLCDEIRLLSQSKSKNRILLVFSNLFENSSLSVYEKQTKNLLIKNPLKIADKFERFHLLPENLSGIKVFFLFKPTTRDEDFDYLKMIDVYKHLLEPRGAKIIVQATNNYLN